MLIKRLQLLLNSYDCVQLHPNLLIDFGHPLLECVERDKGMLTRQSAGQINVKM